MKRIITAAGLAAAVLGCAQSDGPVGVPGAGEAPLGTWQGAVVVCADGPTLQGIDISYYQGTIDWDAVAADGIDFAFIRVSDGVGFEDPEFDRNWAEAARVGIARGVYQFFRPGQDPVAQADLLISRMGALGPGDMPPVADVEDADGESAATIAANLAIWMDRVEAAIGRPPIIYTGLYFWRDSVGGADFAEHPLWIANWGVSCPNIPDPWTDWLFWQDSASGSIAGISGDVDTDIFNGDMAALLAYASNTPVCGDGWCTGDETYDTCPADCPRCEPIPPPGRAVEETEVCFEAGGPAEYWHAESAGSGGSLLHTGTTDHDYVVNYAVWNLDFEEAGNYRVEAYTDAAWAQSRTAPYQVRHDGVVAPVTVDQTLADGWNLVGEFAFAAGGDQWVRVDDNTGEPGSTGTQLVADAVRLTRLDPPAADADADADADAGADADSDGDAAADADADAGADGAGDVPTFDYGAEAGDGGGGSGDEGDGCGCAVPGSRPAAGVFLAAFVLGLASFRRRLRRS
ncbi:MAG: hypothetical protein HY905_22320 [Deltaproteobacteria bacterium]|nr:hypothetical protein [Deltaproteobacteria bacterium]